VQGALDKVRAARLAEAAAGTRHIRDTAALRQLTIIGAVIMVVFGLSETVFLG
jgi:hypothetical protein